jgi:hypothetical protein
MLSLFSNKRKIAFYLSIDPQRKKLYAKRFCLDIIRITENKIKMDILNEDKQISKNTSIDNLILY